MAYKDDCIRKASEGAANPTPGRCVDRFKLEFKDLWIISTQVEFELKLNNANIYSLFLRRFFIWNWTHYWYLGNRFTYDQDQVKLGCVRFSRRPATFLEFLFKLVL